MTDNILLSALLLALAIVAVIIASQLLIPIILCAISIILAVLRFIGKTVLLFFMLFCNSINSIFDNEK